MMVSTSKWMANSILFALIGSACIIISLFTDYWEYVTYDIESLIASTPNGNVTRSKSGHYIQIETLTSRQEPTPDPAEEELGEIVKNATTCILDIELLFDTHAGIWRNCDYLEGSERSEVDNIKPKDRCFYFLYDKSAPDQDSQWLVRMLNSAESGAIVIIVLLVVAVLIATFGLGKKQVSAVMVTGVIYVLAGLFALFTLAIMQAKVKFEHKYEITIQSLPVQYLSSRRFALGWSFTLGWISVFLLWLDCILWIILSNVLRKSMPSV